MDDIVRQAMAKWPNVPDCFGWLGLDARGNWYMRDDRVQSLGAFADGPAAAKGSLLLHEKLIAFINRNYLADAQGRWFFQNGPQRVYVELAVTPWVWRVQADFALESHTGLATQQTACLTDEAGWLYLETPLGFGLVHTQDVGLAAQAIEAGQWSVQSVQRGDLPARYGYTQSPAQQHILLQKK
ncbi:MAG: DUF2946 family protein [Pseudomonadota bacterium]